MGNDSGPDVGVTSFSNPLEFCLLFRALLSKELNLLNAGLTGWATCNSCEPEKYIKIKLMFEFLSIYLHSWKNKFSIFSWRFQCRKISNLNIYYLIMKCHSFSSIVHACKKLIIVCPSLSIFTDEIRWNYNLICKSLSYRGFTKKIILASKARFETLTIIYLVFQTFGIGQSKAGLFSIYFHLGLHSYLYVRYQFIYSIIFFDADTNSWMQRWYVDECWIFIYLYF